MGLELFTTFLIIIVQELVPKVSYFVNQNKKICSTKF